MDEKKSQQLEKRAYEKERFTHHEGRRQREKIITSDIFWKRQIAFSFWIGDKELGIKKAIDVLGISERRIRQLIAEQKKILKKVGIEI